MSSAITGSKAAAATQPSSPPATPPATKAAVPSAIDPLANEQTFLKLLVSQLKNQNPLNPTDSTQFVAQLTSYSQLEQLIGIRKNTTPATTDSTQSTPTQGS